MDIGLKQTSLAIAIVVIAGGAFAVTHGDDIGAGQPLFRPGVVFGAVLTLLFVSVGFKVVFESQQSIDEGWTIIDLAVASALALYLGAGLALLAAGFNGWQVLAHLTIAVGAGIVFVVGYLRHED
ncbi:hypothetical protein [Halococcoides cellulosivorans]|uniref:Uncharacterized protein n=1 Tax=Halococcoides cellulosivorans TaxID=1679096 RepID=A0A2R4X2P6_9EURY|nr:hypothetical protein [Halococcoides cellulosivorans]AWB28065.1 hypothetical protein HARCEL1_10280 [Halococcoides cellulosivorans]